MMRTWGAAKLLEVRGPRAAALFAATVLKISAEQPEAVPPPGLRAHVPAPPALGSHISEPAPVS
jgi:hypothetical protein